MMAMKAFRLDDKKKIMIQKIHISHCTEIEQKFQKIVSKSWFIYPIWTIGTYKLLLVGLEFTVKRSTYIKKLAVMFNFCSYPLPWLG